MNCNAFLFWMQHKTGPGQIQDPDVLAHILACDTCRKIYDLDMCLEAHIQQAFTPQRLPGGLAKKIDRSIENHCHNVI